MIRIQYYRSRDEIALWKEKQAQVIKEEMRVKETIARLAAETNKTRKELPISKQNTVSSEAQVGIQNFNFIHLD